MKIAEALAQARDLPGRSPDLDAELLLAKAVRHDRAWVLAHSEDELSQAVVTEYTSLLKARRFGQPVAYLLGEKEFYGRSFAVTSDVLIPRPDSELLVGEVLSQASPGDVVLDLGTGSGCLAITIALESPQLTILAR